ncbi:YkvA family protein [Pontibacillus sp. HMF3514]|uniref:YkvA family protein n=1 Tax=Pontibacillus sp. HMF3514 TaxID=2692425 RepID=UPI00131F9C12|nr:YkvA family protein [Pontibacillus sp. HMF3514]QHE51608.1 DUF1232 domain-containing protein [Pontibacillus sp. HMF3514]
MNKIKAWAKQLKQQIYVLYLAYKDQRVPWHAKLFAATVVAYAFSPVDLIPDFIPILGYIDDIIIVPLGIMLAFKLIPREVIVECEEKVDEMMTNSKPRNWVVGSLVIFIWVLLSFWMGMEVYELLN